MSSQSNLLTTGPARSSGSGPAATRFGGLDGLRAIAVGLVLVYHFFPQALPGGFLGVDVFFVISGFLITSLLLRERQRHGRIDLFSFWRRRARRLLPALMLVLLVCTTFALFVAAAGQSDILVNIGAQIVGALAFVSNWVFIGMGGDYFTRDNPELFRNTWSLSIEEQFYVLLPLLMLLTLRAHSRLTRALLFILLAAGSAALMVLYAHQGETPTRIYFGSDSHIFGLFAGVSLAVLLQPIDGRPRRQRPPLSSASQAGLIALTVLGLGVLGWLACTLVEGSPQSFTWGFQLGSAAALLVVWSVSRPGAWVGRALDVQPLRWIGERSYGIYLWHWPLLLLVPVAFGGGVAGADSGRLDPLSATAATLLAVAFTFALAAFSYRFIERPVRRHGIRGSIRCLVAAWTAGGRRRTLAMVASSALGIGAVATAIAVTVAPARSSAAEAIERGREAMLREHQIELRQLANTHGLPGAIDGLDGDVQVLTDPPALDPTTEPEVPKGRKIFAVGDSVMLASLPELQQAFRGIRIDASVSRGLAAGVEIVATLADADKLRPVLVVGLGTNGPIDRSELEELQRIADGRPIVLVNAHADRWWIPKVNKTLAQFAEEQRGVVLADWDSAVRPHPDMLAGDGIHPGPSGGRIYAKTVRNALKELQSPAEWVLDSGD